jgi:hypothetical protein|tara:strand:- start:200 stop:703 length:504 start_codon:yes stop_codon:yes gene_type:complete
MKKFFIPTILLLLSCSSGEELPEPIEKITDSGIIFSIQEIKEMGFKKNHEYKVDDLPGAVSAYFGFIKNDLGDPEDYEIRFYNNHSDAIELGIKYTDNVTGENGCISKDCALWEEGLKHRIRMSDLGTLHPKYMSYIVYNNFILMCPGYDEGEALSKCTSIINKLTK